MQVAYCTLPLFDSQPSGTTKGAWPALTQVETRIFLSALLRAAGLPLSTFCLKTRIMPTTRSKKSQIPGK